MDNRRAGGSNSSRAGQDFLMTGVLKHPIFGRRTSAGTPKHSRKILKRLKSHLGYGDQKIFTSRQFTEGSNKYEEFFVYNEHDEDEELAEVQEDEESNSEKPVEKLTGPAALFQNISVNIVDFLAERQFGNTRLHLNLHKRLMPESFQHEPDPPIKHLLTNQILQEKPIKVENLNKVFCSQWLSDRQVIFGTKCNKLMVLDVQTKHMTQIPSLASSTNSIPPETQCGIHSIELNPSKTLVATGGRNPNDMAIYQLPTLDPLCVGEVAHTDWIFALAWLDDQFVVSGSRDTNLALWKVPEEATYTTTTLPSISRHDRHDHTYNFVSPSSSTSYSSMYDMPVRVPSYSYINCVARKECRSAQKVRDIVFNRKLQEIACVSLNGYIHLWAADRFVQKCSRKLPFCMENVCLAVHEDYGLYAVGSKSHTTLLDARTVQCVKKIPSKYSGSGIRSTKFYSGILSIGTGQGTVLFYDLRAGKYLESNVNSARSATLKTSNGWTYNNEEEVVLMDVYNRQKYTPAIYSHCIDMSGTRIFAAGGPLPVTLFGNYLGLWH